MFTGKPTISSRGNNPIPPKASRHQASSPSSLSCFLHMTKPSKREDEKITFKMEFSSFEVLCGGKEIL